MSQLTSDPDNSITEHPFAQHFDTQYNIWMAYISLWSLLQSLEEGGNVIIIIDDKLHVLSHNANGHILKEGPTQNTPIGPDL